MQRYSKYLGIINFIFAIIIGVTSLQIFSSFKTTYSQLAGIYSNFGAQLPIPVDFADYLFIAIIATLVLANLTTGMMLFFKKENGALPSISIARIAISLAIFLGFILGILGINKMLPKF